MKVREINSSRDDDDDDRDDDGDVEIKHILFSSSYIYNQVSSQVLSLFLFSFFAIESHKNVLRYRVLNSIHYI